MNDAEYFASELRKVGDSEVFKIKITGDAGETRWLSLTPEMFESLRTTLTQPESGDVMSVYWNDHARSYFMHARPSGASVWTSQEFPESEVDTMMSLARDIVTGG